MGCSGAKEDVVSANKVEGVATQKVEVSGVPLENLAGIYVCSEQDRKVMRPYHHVMKFTYIDGNLIVSEMDPDKKDNAR